MEERRFEEQPGLVKCIKVATVLMWISWVPFLCGDVRNVQLFLSRGNNSPCDTVYYSSGGSGVPSQFLIV